MKKFGKLHAVLCVLVGIGQCGFAQSPLVGVPQTTLAASGSDVSAKLTLRVYNYAALPRAELQRSEGEAAAIFKQARLEVEWVDCPLSPAEFKSYPACQANTGPTDFVLKILTAEMTKQLHPHPEALGCALPCPRNQEGCTAYILYGNVSEVAEYKVADKYQVLGHAMAHEIGHLLLGPDSHVSSGIMRAHWDRNDLQTAAWAHLLFTKQQSDRIRNEVRERTSSLTGLGLPSEPFRQESSPAITVLQFNYDPQATHEIPGARKRATAVFQQAGVTLDWHDCGPETSHATDDPTCRQVVSPGKIQLRIVPRFKAAPGVADRVSMGFAVGDIATVSFGKVEEFSLYVSRPRFEILGNVMAHEIGHLFLQDAHHSPVGIMRAYWSHEDLELAGASGMAFSPEEAKAIRADLQTRSIQVQLMNPSGTPGGK